MTLLDRFFVTAEWETQFTNSTSYYLPRVFFDHSPIILDFGLAHISLPFHFKFDIVWVSHEGFYELVVRWWTQHYLGTNKDEGWQMKIKIMMR
jgi:hypothetical protein